MAKFLCGGELLEQKLYIENVGFANLSKQEFKRAEISKINFKALISLSFLSKAGRRFCLFGKPVCICMRFIIIY